MYSVSFIYGIQLFSIIFFISFNECQQGQQGEETPRIHKWVLCNAFRKLLVYEFRYLPNDHAAYLKSQIADFIRCKSTNQPYESFKYGQDEGSNSYKRTDSSKERVRYNYIIC